MNQRILKPSNSNGHTVRFASDTENGGHGNETPEIGVTNQDNHGKYTVSVSGPSGDERIVVAGGTTHTPHTNTNRLSGSDNENDRSPSDCEDLKMNQDDDSNDNDENNTSINHINHKNLNLTINTQNVQQNGLNKKKKKQKKSVKFESPLSTAVNPRLSDNDTDGETIGTNKNGRNNNNNNNNNNNKKKIKNKKNGKNHKHGKGHDNNHHTLSPSIVSMNSSEREEYTPRSSIVTSDNDNDENTGHDPLPIGAQSVSVTSGNSATASDVEQTPDSCMSETTYLMNLFHPIARLENSRFDRPEVTAAKERKKQRQQRREKNGKDNNNNNGSSNQRPRKKSTSALAYIEDSDKNRKYSNPIARPKINRTVYRNTSGSANATTSRLSNASGTSIQSMSQVSSAGTRSRGNSGVITPYTPLSIAASVDSLENIPNTQSEIGNYDQHKKLGNGTDAQVYEVIDRRNKQHVAMKLTKRKSGRYRTEIHLLRNLKSCPHVVTLIKCLESDKIYVLVLEHAPMCLEKLLLKKCCEIPMSEANARDILRNVLKGLLAIHNLGFVHKDIKPENVLIFADREHKALQGLKNYIVDT